MAFVTFHGLTGPTSGKLSRIFSNFAPCRIVYDDHVFYASEQVFMYLKAKTFGDDTRMTKILTSLKEDRYEAARRDMINNVKTSEALSTWMKDLVKVKGLGRQVRPFDVEKWNKESISAMIHANLAKYRQDEYAYTQLMATGDDGLAEASPRDLIWGTGVGVTASQQGPTAWRGKNYLGYILMNVRDHYRAHPPTF